MSDPLDLPTVLAGVDAKRYQTPEAYLGRAGIAGIVATMQQYWGEEPAGLRDISAAHAMLDEASTLVQARVSAALADRCR